MKDRAGWACLAVLVLGGCDCHEADDGGKDAGVEPDGGAEPDCADEDGDGYGVGPDCLAEDCDDRDETRQTDCPDCDLGATEPCYGGPAGTVDVGLCRGGERACEEGAWGACVGDVLPVDEVCDGLDENCCRASAERRTWTRRSRRA